MSGEDLHWQPDDMDAEPYARLALPEGEEYLATRMSTELVRHMGDLALYDFIYCEDEPLNTVIFKFTKGFEKLAEYMIENDYPQRNFQTTVSADMVKNYNEALAEISVSEDYVPLSWSAE